MVFLTWDGRSAGLDNWLQAGSGRSGQTWRGQGQEPSLQRFTRLYFATYWGSLYYWEFLQTTH